jgi:hypothetical protein
VRYYESHIGCANGLLFLPFWVGAETKQGGPYLGECQRNSITIHKEGNTYLYR